MCNDMISTKVPRSFKTLHKLLNRSRSRADVRFVKCFKGISMWLQSYT